MGFYIETKEPTEKALQLKRDHGAQVVIQPRAIKEVPNGMVLICVVENGVFDAAAIIFNQAELDAFLETYTRRPRTWMVMGRAEVLKLNPHVEGVLTY